MPVGDDDYSLTQQQWPGVVVPNAECVGWPASAPGNCTKATYTEGLLVGYRYYDAHKIAPAFAFGHGLTYTSFEVGAGSVAVTAAAAGAKYLYDVAYALKNTGKRAGNETVQLYLGYPASAEEPPSQLRGFEKVFDVQPGASVASAAGGGATGFKLTSRDLSIWDVETHEWAEVAGTFTVTVGTSSRDPNAQTATFTHKA